METNQQFVRYANIEDLTRIDSLAVEYTSKQSSMFMSSLNLINCIVGGGIIALPYAMSNCGIPMGLILIAFCAAISNINANLLIIVGSKANSFVYSRIVRKSFGRIPFILFCLCQLFFPLLSSISFSITIGDNLLSLFQYFCENVDILQQRSFVLALVLFGMILPLCLFRNVSFLDKASFISVSLVVVYSIIVIYEYLAISNKIILRTDTWQFIRKDTAKALSVISFVLAFHQNEFSIYQSMKNKNPSSFAKVIHVSVLFTVVEYILIAILGFLTFGGRTHSNLLVSYCYNEMVPNLGRIFFSITLILTFPLQIFASREVLELVIYGKKQSFSWIRHVFTTILLVAICYAVSSSITSVGPVIEIAGSLTAIPIVFIFPPLLFLKVSKGSIFTFSSNVDVIGSWILIICGLSASFVGTITTFVNAIQSSTNSLEIYKYWCVH